MAKERGQGDPRTDEERLKEHFGPDWQNHDVTELPERGSGLERGRAAGLIAQEGGGKMNTILLLGAGVAIGYLIAKYKK